MIHAVIMAGGKGTRFWPLSRSRHPKQFLSILSQATLLEETMSRLRPLILPEHTWIVGSQLHSGLFQKLDFDLPCDQILLEPSGQNTAASIGWAALEILKKDPEGLMVVLPSDHYIRPEASFRSILKKATCIAADTKGLVTIGIRPTHPHTGYGYIEVKSLEGAHSSVLAFHEKPSYEKAVNFLKSGRFFWNSGIFVWKAAVILDFIRRLMPDHAKILDQISTLNVSDPKFKKLFKKFESISIDYGVMEHSYKETTLLFSTFEWSDIGSWGALADFLPKDTHNNAIKGHCMPLDSTGNIVFSPNRMVSLVDVQDMIVVDSEDSILIMPKSSDQKIKLLYEQLPEKLTR